MTPRGAGTGMPGGRRSPSGGEAAGRGRGLGRSGEGRGGGGTGRGGAALRRRDGSGRLDAAASGVAGVAAVSSPAPATTPVPASPQPDQLVGTGVLGVARLTDPDACIGCGICVDLCPRSAIELDDLPMIHEDLCTGCGDCAEACPRGALALVAT